MSVFVIAEAGVNHNGDLKTALKLIDTAKDAGCDAVKFQTYKAHKLVSDHTPKVKYQVQGSSDMETQYEMLKRLELGPEEHKVLFDYCRSNEITFLSTPFDEESADMLQDLGVGIFKIPSGEITNKQLIEHIAKKKKPIILSTGMSTMDEVKEALDWIYAAGNRELTLLHCTSNYPAVLSDVNLKAMCTMKEKFHTEIGYSDHTKGIEIPVAAVALGATVIEKHFTLDRNMNGPDHKASIEPDELRTMVRYIRNVEMTIGNGIKLPAENEMEVRNAARRSIFTCTAIKAGQIILPGMITVKRPGTGLSPKFYDSIINKTARWDLPADYTIQMSDLL